MLLCQGHVLSGGSSSSSYRGGTVSKLESLTPAFIAVPMEHLPQDNQWTL